MPKWMPMILPLRAGYWQEQPRRDRIFKGAKPGDLPIESRKSIKTAYRIARHRTLRLHLWLKPIPIKLNLDLMPTESEFALAVVGARAERSLASILVIASVNISRGIPAKPNHPHEDIGASFYYLIGRIAPRSA